MALQQAVRWGDQWFQFPQDFQGFLRHGTSSSETKTVSDKPAGQPTKPQALVPHWLLFQQSLCSLIAQSVKNLPAMQEAWVRFLGWENMLEKEMATHSCLENPMDRGAWQATAHGVARVGHDLVTKSPLPLRSRILVRGERFIRSEEKPEY